MQNPGKGISLHPLSHPRRPPAHKSVSLLHTRTLVSRSSGERETEDRISRTNTESASNQANASPSVASRPTTKYKQSSGESSNAEKWFESTNNNPDQSNVSYTNNEPPFFLRHSSSSGTPPDNVEERIQLLPAALPYRAGQTQDAYGSSSEDFRSVIDDLTIENKKLKRKLKKYERLHDAHLQSEKLFEVKVHGLLPEKKRELEDLLRKFASNTAVASNTGTTPSSGNRSSGHETERISSSFAPNNATSSLSSTRVADSGYASNSLSASGNGSFATSGQDSRTLRKLSKSAKARQQQNIRSYLRDIPPGLLPKQNVVVLSEKSKKKMVVRRLEQIFAGKGAGIGNHSQHLQQQEVAQSAANADRKAIEESGLHARKEGIREARIMPQVANPSRIELLPHPDAVNTQRLDPIARINELDFVGGGQSPDQRPTRPLDLDPHRAQVPEENIEYIRHLGFSPPDPDSTEAQPDGHGWIYLNLLMNMAQLHTINVTPEFVRKAVQEYSKKLELCPDGRKVRWKGGREVTLTSSDGSPLEPSNSTDDLRMTKKHVRKRIQLGQDYSEHNSSNLSKSSGTLGKKGELAYTPLFFHEIESDEEANNSDGNMSISSSNHMATGTSPGFTSSGIKSSTSRVKKSGREDGPIIFYQGNFCTDLSRKSDTHALDNKLNYNSLPTEPVGAAAPSPPAAEYWVEGYEPKGVLAQEHLDSNMDVEYENSSTDNDLKMALIQSPTSSASPNTEAINFEASGLGGVEPKDNFSIEVLLQKRRDREAAPIAAHCYRSRHYSSKIQSILAAEKGDDKVRPPNEAQEAPAVSEEVIAMRHKQLPASSVPEPTHMYYDSASESSDGEPDSELLSEPLLLDGPHPTTARQKLDTSSSQVSYSTDEEDNIDDNEEEEDDDDDDGSEDGASEGSLDFLATARDVDPRSVMDSERQYDAELAERLAGEIPAGSSAATAGGGSGFNSPVSSGRGSAPPPSIDEVVRATGSVGSKAAKRTAGVAAPGLKRTRTSDSQTLPGKLQKREGPDGE